MDSREDIKPRLICCPDFALRGRVGLIAYNILKFLKKKYPEFFLARKPEDI